MTALYDHSGSTTSDFIIIYDKFWEEKWIFHRFLLREYIYVFLLQEDNVLFY